MSETTTTPTPPVTPAGPPCTVMVVVKSAKGQALLIETVPGVNQNKVLTANGAISADLKAVMATIEGWKNG